ncbi:hypothetical protein [Umezawaea sp. Da 62-37]|uniref:hypothetical protein n=1 Tax=Umezawaea sp. Da 62-37 TaxID=3075927 RepID=UPI0028F7235F|nr:hypothetical protein [Umezawaea sp. Da 62-37]WNV85390.1 hypothetical protein RM788_45945 [Umezawaea sp. Da 62-37]
MFTRTAFGVPEVVDNSRSSSSTRDTEDFLVGLPFLPSVGGFAAGAASGFR